MNREFIEQFLNCGALIKTAEDRILVGWGQRVWLKTQQKNQPALFYFPDFFLRNPFPWFKHEHSQEMSIQELIQLLGFSEIAKVPNIDHWRTEGKEIFFKTFGSLKDKFASGELMKAVPYVFEVAAVKMDAIRLRGLICHILAKANVLPIQPYGFWNENEGILGGTPETLFKLDKAMHGASLHTVACAGTSTQDQAEMLLQDPKEMHEHDLVIQGMQESLRPFGRITRQNTKILSLASLCHLVTPLSLELTSDFSYIKLVEALHPTPALGAFPRIPGAEWLKNYQTLIKRGRYGAPAGYYLSGRAEGGCYVAIRNLQWSGCELKIGAGCGVVPQSIYEKEWDEIQLKIQSVKNLFQL